MLRRTIKPSLGGRCGKLWSPILSDNGMLHFGGDQVAVTSCTPGPWTAAGRISCGRKVRAPQGKVVGNAHRSQEQGKCHRKQTAGRPQLSWGDGKDETVG